MSTIINSNANITVPPAAVPAEGRRSRRKKTSHLKEVPESLEARESLRKHCQELAAKLNKTHLISKDEMETLSRSLLEQVGLDESYLGWTMVMLSSEFWREQVAATPPERRLLLLPHCLKHAEGCPADYDEFGLDCRTCGACSIADFRTLAEDMGYKVLVAEGSPIVMKIIVSGYIDAIIGVACLNVLEKAIDKILLAGIPCIAVPLLSSDCRNTSVDEAWVTEAIQSKQTALETQTSSYIHLLRAARRMFEPTEFDRLMPPIRKPATGDLLNGVSKPNAVSKPDAVGMTESIAREFIGKGGKYSRPFITLAVYDALTGNNCTGPNGATHTAELSDAVQRAALSIEAFHKASLVHDDIQDDDDFRYGEPTLHRKHGIATAINVGDYLIGLGYRLVSRDAAELGPETAANILDKLAESHMKLSEGQGAELHWRDSSEKHLTPLDALKIYALKTSPAFEAALVTGFHLAGKAEEYGNSARQFAKHLGVAFQILNDLKDWQGDDDNKLTAGDDLLKGRPTILWALALESLSDTEREELEQLASDSESLPQPPLEGNQRSEKLEQPDSLRPCSKDPQAAITRARQLYHSAGVFEKANAMVDKHQDRAEAIIDQWQSDSLRRLGYFLIDSVLQRGEETTVTVELPVLK